MSTEISKINTYDNTTDNQGRCYITMKNISNPNWISADVQARGEPPTIPLIKAETEEEKASKTIKVKMRQNPDSAASETYNMKMATFENGQQEEFLMLLKNFKTAFNRSGTMSVAGRNNYLRTMLRGEDQQEFY